MGLGCIEPPYHSAEHAARRGVDLGWTWGVQYVVGGPFILIGALMWWGGRVLSRRKRPPDPPPADMPMQ